MLNIGNAVLINPNFYDIDTGSRPGITESMYDYAGKHAIITKCCETALKEYEGKLFRLDVDDGSWVWHEDWLISEVDVAISEDDISKLFE